MSGRRWLGIVGTCGAISLSALALTQAQPPGNAPEATTVSPRKKLQEQVATLRSEIGLLDIQMKAAGTSLLHFSRRTARADFVKQTGAMTAPGLALIYMKVLDDDWSAEQSNAFLAAVTQALDGQPDRAKAETELNDKARQDVASLETSIHKSLKQSEDVFFKLSLERNRKVVELEELEARLKGAR